MTSGIYPLMVFYSDKRIILGIMEKARSFNHLLPAAYGNEEETMMMVGGHGEPLTDFTEAKTFVEDCVDFLPAGIKRAPKPFYLFLQNGGMIYDGGASDDGANLERTTPECSTLDEITAAIEANERLVVKMSENYVHATMENELPEEIRLQRRVVSSIGTTRASHDNFQAHNIPWLVNLRHSRSEAVIMAHLGTRSPITGAGYVTPTATHFAQKVQHLTEVDSYSYVNSAYRNALETDTGPRLEIRCNDINLSPWATRIRIGTSALLLTALQTPMIKDLAAVIPGDFKAPEDWLKYFRVYNEARLDNEGVLNPSPKLYESLDFQERLYTMLGGPLKKYVDIETQYLDVISEGIQYIHDMRKVLRGDEPLSYLSDRADFAVKFCKIAASMQRGREDGYDREPTDIISQMWDLRYDTVRVSPGSQNKPRVEYGYGYKFRDRGGFKNKVSDQAVETALYYPPKTTRAFVRGTLIRNRMVASCDWATITVDTDDEKLSALSFNTFDLNQVVIRGLRNTTDVINYMHDLAIEQQSR